jgi:ubiquitin-protein ligase
VTITCSSGAPPSSAPTRQPGKVRARSQPTNTPSRILSSRRTTSQQTQDHPSDPRDPNLRLAGGVFSLRMTFGEQYPEKPPRVRFTSEVFHPNVYSDGTLCMDIIQDQWSPIHNVCTLLTSIQSLLTDPNPSSPANPEAAQLFQEDPSQYNRRVRRLAQKTIEG